MGIRFFFDCLLADYDKRPLEVPRKRLRNEFEMGREVGLFLEDMIPSMRNMISRGINIEYHGYTGGAFNSPNFIIYDSSAYPYATRRPLCSVLVVSEDPCEMYKHRSGRKYYQDFAKMCTEMVGTETLIITNYYEWIFLKLQSTGYYYDQKLFVKKSEGRAMSDWANVRTNLVYHVHSAFHSRWDKYDPHPGYIDSGSPRMGRFDVDMGMGDRYSGNYQRQRYSSLRQYPRTLGRYNDRYSNREYSPYVSSRRYSNRYIPSSDRYF